MNKLQESIVQALVILIKSDNELIKTQLKEECINHKLAQYLEQVLLKKDLLKNLDVDMEYNKYKNDKNKSPNGYNIRPDIIVHERQSGNKNNLIVIEAKKGYDTKADRRKVEDLVNSEGYRYTVGALISYFPMRAHIKIKFLTSGRNWEKYVLDKIDFTIRSVNK